MLNNAFERVKDGLFPALSRKEVENMVEDLNSPFQGSVEGVGALANLIKKLENRLDDYDTILSDEASGRIPSLILRQLINKKKLETGNERVRFRAVSGGRVLEHVKDSVREHLSDLLQQEGGFGKTLLVTEYINTAQGITWLAEILDELGVDFDIAAISANKSANRYDDVVSDRLVCGFQGSREGVDFYGQSRSSGVWKSASRSPVPFKFETDQANINETRDSISKLSDRLYKKLLEDE